MAIHLTQPKQAGVFMVFGPVFANVLKRNPIFNCEDDTMPALLILLYLLATSQLAPIDARPQTETLHDVHCDVFRVPSVEDEEASDLVLSVQLHDEDGQLITKLVGVHLEIPTDAGTKTIYRRITPREFEQGTAILRIRLAEHPLGHILYQSKPNTVVTRVVVPEYGSFSTTSSLPSLHESFTISTTATTTAEEEGLQSQND